MKKAILVFVVMAVLAAFADNPHITQLIELVDVALSSPQNGDVLTFNSSTGKWNNQQPATQDGPKIVVNYKQENVVGNITPFTLFTPDENAVYRGTVVVLSPVSSTCSGIGDIVGINVLDSDGSSLTSAFGRLGTGHTTTGENFPFIATAGSSWTVNSFLSSFGPPTGTDDCPYNFYIVVEKL